MHALIALLAHLHAGAVVAVIGLPRFGKTVLLQNADEAGAFPRRVVFDPYNKRDRLEALRGEPVSPWNGTRVVSPRELENRPELLCRDPLALVVQPERLDKRSLGKDFSSLLQLAWAVGGIDILGEEAALYSRDALDEILQVATGGGHAGMRLFLISQSLSQITIYAHRYINVIIAYAQTQPGDLKSLRERCGKEFALRVQRHVKGNPPCVWMQGEGDITERVVRSAA